MVRQSSLALLALSGSKQSNRPDRPCLPDVPASRATHLATEHQLLNPACLAYLPLGGQAGQLIEHTLRAILQAPFENFFPDLRTY